MVIAQELPADPEHHRTVARHDRGECGLIGRFAPGGEPLEQLAIGEPRGAAALVEQSKLPDQRR